MGFIQNVIRRKRNQEETSIANEVDRDLETLSKMKFECKITYDDIASTPTSKKELEERE